MAKPRLQSLSCTISLPARTLHPSIPLRPHHSLRLTTITTLTSAHTAPTTISARHLSLTCPRPSPARTVEQARSKQVSGGINLRALGLFFITAGGLAWYFIEEKKKMQRARIAGESKGVGKPRVGGEFTLTDTEGNEFTEKDMRGGFSIVYFGFTHCPDICPDELDKLAKIIDQVNTPSSSPSSAPSLSTFTLKSPSPPPQPLLPIFITCDPARDTPSVLSSYLKEFHPGIVGLTGTWAQIRDVCKKYRVYFSTPEGVKAGEDYLVDHSIYFYLMDPEGDFVEAIGRQHDAETAAKIIRSHVGDWRGGVKKE